MQMASKINHRSFDPSLLSRTNMTRQISQLFPVLLVVGLMQVLTLAVAAEPQVPCFFIFGGTLVDSGNNNGLVTAAKANYPPYGIDFPQGASGRFTNNRTIVDFLGQLLGMSGFISPYVSVTDQEISTGVNYGSGSAGIREETGSHLGDRFSMDRQLLNHAKILARLLLLQRNKTFTQEYVKKCIYVSIIGNNDYINNYLMPNNYSTSRIYTADEYAEVLRRQYSQQLRTLYKLGARKVAVYGLGRLGCTPGAIARFGTDGKPCVESINDAVKLFNDRLKPLVDEINNDFFDAKYTFINFTSISTSRRVVPLPNGPCCQVRADGQCVRNSIPCPIRDLTAYYDDYQPTDIANNAIATRSYRASSILDASPYDIRILAQL